MPYSLRECFQCCWAVAVVSVAVVASFSLGSLALTSSLPLMYCSLFVRTRFFSWHYQLSAFLSFVLCQFIFPSGFRSRHRVLFSHRKWARWYRSGASWNKNLWQKHDLHCFLSGRMLRQPNHQHTQDALIISLVVGIIGETVWLK